MFVGVGVVVAVGALNLNVIVIVMMVIGGRRGWRLVRGRGGRRRCRRVWVGVLLRVRVVVEWWEKSLSMLGLPRLLFLLRGWCDVSSVFSHVFFLE